MTEDTNLLIVPFLSVSSSLIKITAFPQDYAAEIMPSQVVNENTLVRIKFKALMTHHKVTLLLNVYIITSPINLAGRRFASIYLQ